MPESLVQYMSLELLAGTEELHRRKIIHADTKADNVMISNLIGEPADRWTVDAVLEFTSVSGINGAPVLKVSGATSIFRFTRPTQVLLTASRKLASLSN